MTIEDVVRVTQSILKEINVPAGLTNQIAIPISHAIDNLQVCIDAFEREREAENVKKEPNKPERDEPEQAEPEIVEVKEIGNADTE